MAHNKGTSGAIGSLIAIALAWYGYDQYVLPRQVATGMAEIEKAVATDAVKQYQITKRQGDKMQICVQAGLVTAAFLQAKAEDDYREWKA